MPAEKPDLYKVLYPAFKFELHRRMDIETHGNENILDVPAVYVANHARMVDSPLIALAVTKETGIPLRFLAKKEYFDGLGLAKTETDPHKFGRSLKFLMEYAHMLPIDRENPDMEALRRDAAKALGKSSLAIHGEGTRVEDGKIHRFKPGGAIIAVENDKPIVPTGIIYTDYSNGRKTHVDIMFGEALLPKDFIPANGSERRQVLDLTNAVEEQVAHLTGMERTNKSAILRKLRDLGGDNVEISE